MSRIRVRFHLAKSQHYMHWQLREKDSIPVYYDPSEVVLVMRNATLKNRRRTAEKIFNGESDKTVCAWIEVDSRDLVVLRHSSDNEKVMLLNEWMGYDSRLSFINYNPRIAPYWRKGDEHEDVDNKIIPFLFTAGKAVLSLNTNKLPSNTHELFFQA